MKRRHIFPLTLLLAVGNAQADLAKGLQAVQHQRWAQAHQEFLKSAEQGDAQAATNLGTLHMKGLGTPQDYPKALHWFQLAADVGDPTGQSKLGLMYFYGLGTEEDRGEAVRWFRKAAEQGELSAQMVLGSIYADGQGVPADKAEGYFWYAVAADQNHPEAAERKQALADEMSPGELNEALERLQSWRQSREPSAATALQWLQDTQPEKIAPPKRHNPAKVERKKKKSETPAVRWAN